VKESNEQVEALLSEVYSLPSVVRAKEYLCRSPISELPYHNENHTLDVVREAVLFALTEEVEKEDILILSIAAAWHDVGFSISAIEHEEHSARLFNEDFDKAQWKEIRGSSREYITQMIHDTKVHFLPMGSGSQQFARTDLSRYLLDADLSNLGREDFFESFAALLQETGAEEYTFSVATLGLISRHRWHTEAAELLRLEQEMRNARELVDRIKSLGL